MNGFTGDEIRRAQEEWQSAREYFETVSAPELVDYAIYRLEAARVRYSYMLKRGVEKSSDMC